MNKSVRSIGPMIIAISDVGNRQPFLDLRARWYVTFLLANTRDSNHITTLICAVDVIPFCVSLGLPGTAHT